MEEKLQFDIQNKENVGLRGCCIHDNSLIGRKGSEQKCAKLAAYDWLANIPLPANSVKFDCAEVRFKNNHKDFFRIPEGLHGALICPKFW